MTGNKTPILFRVFQGCILTIGILSAVYQIFDRQFNNYIFAMDLALIILNSLLMITIHESGHAFFLAYKKLPVRSIYIPFISVHFGAGIKCKVSTIRFGEGLVIPDLPVINTEEEFRRLKQILSDFLLAGPIASILYCSIVIIGYLYMQFGTEEKAGYWNILFFQTCIQTFFLIQNCFRETATSTGDLVGYDKVAKEDLFAASYIFCCYFFSTDYKTKVTKSIYIKSIMKERLKGMSEDKLIDEARLLDEIIYRAISGLDEYFIDFLDPKIYSILNNMSDSLVNQNQWETGVVSAYIHAIMYIIIVCNDRNSALHLYVQNEELLQQHPNRTCKYLLYQVRYLLYLEKNMPSEIYPIPEFEKWNYYEQYYECEKAILLTKSY